MDQGCQTYGQQLAHQVVQSSPQDDFAKYKRELRVIFHKALLFLIAGQKNIIISQFQNTCN